MLTTFSDLQYIYHIDSHQRITGSHQDGTYKIELDGYKIQDFDRVVILSATIPKSYYCIENGFKIFSIFEDGSENIITIPEGTYSASQFKDTLPQILTSSSLKGYTYTMSFSSITAKFTYTVTGRVDPVAEQVYIRTTRNVYEQLGFTANNDFYFSSDPSGVLVSTTVIDMSPENNIFIRSDICQSADNNSDILQDLQGSGVPPYGQINYQCTNLEGYSKGLNNNSNIYRFYITNEDDEGQGQRILQLNDKNWTATLLLYKRTTLPKMIKNTIKYNILKNNI
jgi:hypothetical protein